MNFLKQLIIKPLDGYLHLTAWLLFACMYCQIIFSPTAIFCMLSLVSFSFFEFDVALNIVYASSFMGFIVGIIWAEHIRKKHGIINFHGYLLSTPEIEGWRDKNGNPISRKPLAMGSMFK